MFKDQKELLSEFNDLGIEYVIVGGHAVNAHGVPRTTKDLDVFIRSERPNTDKVLVALARFGAPLEGLTEADFRDPESHFQIGLPPQRIDVLNSIQGVQFDQVWQNRIEGTIDGSIPAAFISREDLILNKQAAGRPRDLADVALLRQVERLTEIKRDGSVEGPGKSGIQLRRRE